MTIKHLNARDRQRQGPAEEVSRFRAWRPLRRGRACLWRLKSLYSVSQLCP